MFRENLYLRAFALFKNNGNNHANKNPKNLPKEESTSHQISSINMAAILD